MNDLDRLERLLATARLHPPRFERCAQDLLSDVFPGLTPIPGGTDWGRDGDIAGTDEGAPPRLLATSARSIRSIKANLTRGIASMREHSVPVRRLILATPGNLNLLSRQKLSAAAAEAGLVLDVHDVFDQGFFASRLRRDGYWRHELLGLSSQPISLSRTSPDAAESAWAFLPLVGRREDVEELGRLSDVFLVGPPGVGKSRLLQEVPGVVFVDKAATWETIASDLRWTTPETVVVDDAAASGELVSRLHSLRRTEPDLFSYKIVASCWAHQLEELRASFRDFGVYQLDLMEPSQLDAILQEMGVTNSLARREILAQSEGRPGWAVNLADLLLRTRDAQSLLQGSALMGEVNRFFQRAQVSIPTRHALALVAALRGIDETHLAALATELNLAEPELGNVLTGVARSGLLDVNERYDWESRRTFSTYEVRPPMLADVLAAEHAYAMPVPTLRLEQMADRWPDHVSQLTQTVIRAALLGARGARRQAQSLFERVMRVDGIDARAKQLVAREYMMLDQEAAGRVLELMREALPAWRQQSSEPNWSMDPLVEIAYGISVRYADRGAVRFLLEVAALDHRPTNPNPGHPLRKIADLVHEFHPELPVPWERRYLVADALEDWIQGRAPDADEWRVAAVVVEALLSLRLSAAYSMPGQPHQIQLIETVLPAAQIERIRDALLPQVMRMAAEGPSQVSQAALDGVREWLRVGGGYDRPFGREHDPSSVELARQLGEESLREIAAIDLSPGLRQRVMSIARDFDVELGDQEASSDAFFIDLDRRTGDWQAHVDNLQQALRVQLQGWEADPPEQVCARLVSIKGELAAAGLNWPNRVRMATDLLGVEVEHPEAWLRAAITSMLLPEGLAFAARLERETGIEADLVEALLENAASRGEMMFILLASERPGRAVSVAAERLQPHDSGLLQTLFAQQRLSRETITTLLTASRPEVRALVAASWAYMRHYDADWAPGDLEASWLAALDEYRPWLVGLADHDLHDLLDYMNARYPSALADLLERCVLEAPSNNLYASLDAILDWLPNAADETKTRLWLAAPSEHHRWLMRQHLAGADVTWLAAMIDAGHVTPEDAVDFFSGPGARPPTPELARLLVPRGVAPREVAAILHSGSWMGEETEHNRSIANHFEELRSSEDASVRAVADAGVEMFTAASAEAAERERRQRIRGLR